MGDGIHNFRLPVVSLHEGIGCWLDHPPGRGLCVLPHSVLLCKVTIELCTSFFYHRILVPLAAGVGEIACDKNKVAGSGHNLFRNVRDFPSVGEVNRCLYLVDDCFERLIFVVRHIQPWRVKF